MPKKILIIDDELGIRDLFRFLLEGQGYQVLTAPDGQAGIEIIKENSIDLVFLDIHMPKMLGPEVLKIIKQIKPAQPVVIFSSSSDPNFAFENEAKELGAFECIYKPVDIDTILAIIKKATGQ